MMAWRRLASDLRRRAVSSSSPPFAPSRAFSAANNPTFLGREALQGIWSRCSSSAPAFQARAAPGLGALLATRVSSGVRPKLPGLLKGFGTGGAAIAVVLYPREIAQAAERPAGSSSQDNTLLSPHTKQMLRKLWNLLRKFQLPISQGLDGDAQTSAWRRDPFQARVSLCDLVQAFVAARRSNNFFSSPPLPPSPSIARTKEFQHQNGVRGRIEHRNAIADMCGTV